MALTSANVPADLWSNPRPEELIACLERRQLEGLAPPPVALYGQLDGTDFVRVREIGRISAQVEQEAARWHRRAEDLLCGLYGLSVEFAYLIVGRSSEVAVYAGLRGARRYGPRGDTLLHSILRGLYPGIRLDDSPAEGQRLGQRLKAAGLFACQGAMTGIPTPKQVGEGRECPWDALVDALFGQTWGCFILAKPLPMQQVLEVAGQVSEARRVYSFHAREQRQKGPGVSADVEGGLAHDALTLVQKTLERFQLAKVQGMWAAEVHFFAPDLVTVSKTASLLRSAFAGEASLPEPVRVLLCSGGAGGGPLPVATALTSSELATLAQLPRQEKHGYVVRECARFDVAAPDRPSGQSIVVGQILDGTRDTGQPYAIERASLAKHVLVAGVTGSGKTNTCIQLLDQVWQRGRGVPFLVIEPAKTEYRDLLKATDKNGGPLFPGLRVFTLGDERIAPFRLNPFEFETLGGHGGVHVQTHLDQLKSIFFASFVLYPPMPHVLERCLHEVYRDRGWDLASGQNRRLAGTQTKLPPEAFPTLTDLYNKVGEVVGALGYEERIRQDVRAALETRINSLRLGGKGLMLDTRQSVAIKEVLAHPTVLELESIGDDEEKAFVIGLFLSRLYETRVAEARLQRATGQRPPALQHVTLIEEAHRLLRHVPAESHPDTANIRGKAIEAFTNMLSEIRAYGEGIVVAEQIPAKLAPDVVKNTNLKVLHRLVAEDDRQLVGSTMNLDEAQKRFVTTLETGQAVVFAEGEDRPLLVAVAGHPAVSARGQVGDPDVVALMRGFCSGRVYAPFPECPGQCRAMAAGGGRCPHHVRDRARTLADHPAVQRALGIWVVSTAESEDEFAAACEPLLAAVRQLASGQPRNLDDVLWCTVTQGMNLLFERRARDYDWRFNIASALKARFLAAAAGLAPLGLAARLEDRAKVGGAHRAGLARFSQGYQQQCARPAGPHTGCDFCAKRCLYRHEAAAVVVDQLLKGRLLAALRAKSGAGGAASGNDAMWGVIRRIGLEAAGQVIVSKDKGALNRVALCCVAQAGAALGFSPAAQRQLVKGMARALS